MDEVVKGEVERGTNNEGEGVRGVRSSKGEDNPGTHTYRRIMIMDEVVKGEVERGTLVLQQQPGGRNEYKLVGG